MQAEKEIQRLNEELEQRVMDRTAQLKAANKGLEKGSTKRKEAQEALRKSQESLLLAQEVAHFGNFERDLKTNKGWWSDDYYRILGVSRQECEPTFENFLNFVHPEDVEHLKTVKAKATVKAGIDRYDFRIIRPSGEVRTVYGQTRTFADESGTPIRKVGTLLDITERKQLEEQLLQAQKMEAIGYSKPEKGTTFKVCLPRAEEAVARAESPNKSEKPFTPNALLEKVREYLS